MKTMTQTELVRKLATLPTWDAALRRQLHADFSAYVPLVSRLVPNDELKFLAVDLPAMWDPNRPSVPSAEKLVRAQTWLIIQSFSHLYLVALFVLLMDERERVQNASRKAGDELTDDLPF